MNNILSVLIVLAFMGMATAGFAGEVEYGLDGVVKNGTIETRIGKLTFEHG